jgi:ParB family chromosome partitioning protein
MSKRQDYLASLLGGAEPALPSPAETASPPVEPPASPAGAGRPAPGMTLLARESALARIAAGEVKQVTQLLLDPVRVRIWSGNARHQASLNEAACRDLIDSILAEGGQKVPVVVRRVTDDPDHDYELIAGTRRHWSVSWLRANSYPNTQLLAQVQNLDDESAFRLADLENRARKDVSDFERARNYRDALKTYYGSRHNRMAERLNLSKGWLSKMVAVADLPDWAVLAFSSPAEIQLKTCYPLAQKINSLSEADPAALKRMKVEAERLAREQAKRRKDGQPLIAAAEVTGLLVMAASATSAAPGSLFAADSAHGRLAVSVISSNRNGATVRVHAGSGASEAELVALFEKALASLREQGRSVAG